MNMMKTCPICGSKAAKGAKTCYECYYRFSDQSTRNVKLPISSSPDTFHSKAKPNFLEST
jgi:uncharacterized membrane protein YvbJ